MKKLITVAVVTVVGFFAAHALADRMPTIPAVVSFDLVYQPQGSNSYTTSTSGTVTTYVNKCPDGKKASITSKDIIKLIGAVFETNFPSGSQLALYEGEIVIVDSTDANVIFYPDEATPPNSSDWGFNYQMGEGIYWGKFVSNSLGDDNEDYTERSIIHIFLYNHPGSVGLTAKAIPTTDTFDLALGGLVTYDFSYTRKHSDYSWVEKVHGKLTGLAGEGSIDDQYGILTGSAEVHGSDRGTVKE
jgi:hypothetical protein